MACGTVKEKSKVNVLECLCITEAVNWSNYDS